MKQDQCRSEGSNVHTTIPSLPQLIQHIWHSHSEVNFSVSVSATSLYLVRTVEPRQPEIFSQTIRAASPLESEIGTIYQDATGEYGSPVTVAAGTHVEQALAQAS